MNELQKEIIKAKYEGAIGVLEEAARSLRDPKYLKKHQREPLADRIEDIRDTYRAELEEVEGIETKHIVTWS